jgi:hypothetical protein
MLRIGWPRLVFDFSDRGQDCSCWVGLRTTVRVPDDGRVYPLSMLLDDLPLRARADMSVAGAPSGAATGEFLTTFPSGCALALTFGEGPDPDGFTPYQDEPPFAIKLGLRGVNVLTGLPLADGLQTDPQDYIVAPDEPWLNGYPLVDGMARQLVAGPASGVIDPWTTADLELIVYPMRPKGVAARTRCRRRPLPGAHEAPGRRAAAAAGFALGGRIRERLFSDPYGIDSWDLQRGIRCRITFLDAVEWLSLTGTWPEHEQTSFNDYAESGWGWFELRAPRSDARTARRKLIHRKELDIAPPQPWGPTRFR